MAGINGAVPYFCNLVGNSFLPCLNNVAAGTFNAAGAGYPINYFQSNPYSQNIGSSYTVAEGYSNYNALQVDFRQRAWHGLQFDANSPGVTLSALPPRTTGKVREPSLLCATCA